jgi:pimeloyl-ACP methyl ester carboxylesterase
MERKEFLKMGSLAAAGLALLPKTNLLGATKPGANSASTVATSFIEAGGIKFAYRRFGHKIGLPLVLTNYLTGTMDNWDPAVIDNLAKEREVIIFDNAGVASSTGTTPNTVEQMAKDAYTFVSALGLKKIDLLGFSIGGMVAQSLTYQHPELIRKLILIGTGPSGGERMEDYTPQVWALFKKQYPHADELLLDTFFTPTKSSQAAGWEYMKRIRARVGKETALSDKVVPAQLAAIFGWGKKHANSFEYLKSIKQPTLIVHGDADIICPTINGVLIKENLENSELVVYPNANHAPHYQYPEDFVQKATHFLNQA